VRINPFSAAKQHLWNGEQSGGERFMCHAISRAQKAGQITEADRMTANRMIHTRLGEYPYVESWLCNEAGVLCSQLDPVDVQAYRFLWLEDLEKHWNQGVRE
jgi:hypothetical protein